MLTKVSNLRYEKYPLHVSSELCKRLRCAKLCFHTETVRVSIAHQWKHEQYLLTGLDNNWWLQISAEVRRIRVQKGEDHILHTRGERWRPEDCESKWEGSVNSAIEKAQVQLIWGWGILHVWDKHEHWSVDEYCERRLRTCERDRHWCPFRVNWQWQFISKSRSPIERLIWQR